MIKGYYFLYLILTLTLTAAEPKSSFTFETGSTNTVLTEKIIPLNKVIHSAGAFQLEPLPSTSTLPDIAPNPAYPKPSQGSILPPHLVNPAKRISKDQITLRTLSDPSVATLPEVEAVNRLQVLWNQYMKVLRSDNPTYQTYMNWAVELGPAKMGCLERFMACTEWCGTTGIDEKFPNCDPDQNGAQFRPGDPTECARPLNKLPQDPTQPWPGGSGC